jgi:(2Fe-2S) ferredoxin
MALKVVVALLFLFLLLLGCSALRSCNLLPLMAAGPAAAAAGAEGRGRTIKVCADKLCRKAGSADTLSLLQGMAGSGVQGGEQMVCSSGCLGRCGQGPNVGAEPSGAKYQAVSKPITAAVILQEELGITVDSSVVQALELKQSAERKLKMGSTRQALVDLDAALALGSLRGIALSNVWLVKGKAALRVDRGPAGLAAAEAAAREALAAHWSTECVSFLCDALEGQGKVREAMQVIGNAGADSSALLSVKLQRLVGKLESTPPAK